MNKQQSIPVEALVAIGLTWGILGEKGWLGIIGTIITVIIVRYVKWKWSR